MCNYEFLLQKLLDFISAAMTNLSPFAWNFLVVSTKIPHSWDPLVLAKPGKLITLLASDLTLTLTSPNFSPLPLTGLCVSYSWGPRVAGRNLQQPLPQTAQPQSQTDRLCLPSREATMWQKIRRK